MNQDLMFFEAEAVATEAAKCEAQRAAEQHERDAKAAAKVLLQAAREKMKAEKLAKTEDWRRRTAQADLPHVRNIEEPGLGAGMEMLGDDAAGVLHRHLIAGEGDHAGTARAVQIEKRSML